MEVSKELLEAAAHSMLHGNAAQQQEAVEFFETWQNSESVLTTATQIFFVALNEAKGKQNSESSGNGLTDSLQFIMCCVILDVSSSDSWYKYGVEQIEEIRQNLINITYNFNHSKRVSEKLDQIIANVAFNEWPENWTDFLPMIQHFLDAYIESKTKENTFTESSTHVYRTLFHFLKLISGSTKISLKRRSQLLELFITNLPNFIQSIIKENSINMESNTADITVNNLNEIQALNSFLEFTSQLFLIIQSNQEITTMLSQFLFETFIEMPSALVKSLRGEINSESPEERNEEISKKILELEKLSSSAFQNLTLLLSKTSYLEHLIIPIINLFESQVEKDNEEQQNNRFNSSFCEFVCNLLMNIIKPIFENTESNAKVLQIDSSNASQIESLLNITLVFAPRDHYCEDFWIFWNHILTKINSTNEKEKENNQQFFEIFNQIISSLLPLILTTFYEIIPCSTNLSRLKSRLTASSLDFLLKMVPQETIEFMISQPPSLSLCYSLGILKNEQLIPKLMESVEFVKNALQSEEPEMPVISAILFALSRNSPLIMKSPADSNSGERQEIIQILVDFFKTVSYNFLVESEDSDYQETLLLALNHLGSHAPTVFIQDMEFVDILLNVASDPSKLEKDNFSRLCNIIAKIILVIPPDNKDQYVERLISIASVPLLSGDLDAIVVGTQAAYSIASISFIGSKNITKYLWKPLIAAMKTTSVVPDHFLFSDIVGVFASSIRMASYSQCKKYINQFMEISLQTLSVSQNESKETAEQPMSEPLNPVSSNSDDLNLTVSVLDAYNMMCQMYHDSVDEYRDLFANTFAQTMANNPAPCFFEFFVINGLKENEERQVVECACSSLTNPDGKITKAAALLLKKLISKRKDPQFIAYWQPKIIRSVFLSLFDELHNEPLVLLSVIHVIYAIYKRHIRNSSLSPIIDQIVVDAIGESVGDGDMSLHIAKSMRCVADKKEEFIQLIKDFLGTYGRMNPVEMKMFDDSLALFSQMAAADNQDSVSLFQSNSSSDVVDIRNFSQVHY